MSSDISLRPPFKISSILAALRRIFFVLLFEESRRNIFINIFVISIYAIIVVAAASHHVMWRDEVRALSIALTGDSYPDMLRALHGEGHPAIWYLLLRTAYAVFGSVTVLAGLALVVAVAAAALLVFLSPFPRILVILILASQCFLYEYAVMARNYGIAALVMFIIAAVYDRRKDRGIVIGLLLFILANTNLIAAIMVGPFLLFWLIEIVRREGLCWNPKLAHFTLNAVIAAVGILVCALTILPTFNDAAAYNWSYGSPVVPALKALINPGDMAPGSLLAWNLPNAALRTALLFGMTLGLLPRPGAFIAAVAGLGLLSIFSAVVAWSGERHAMVWLCFCIMLYWISWREIKGAFASLSRNRLTGVASLAGCLAFALVLVAQARHGFEIAKLAIRGSGFAASSSAAFGGLIKERPDLAHAVVIGEPDFMVEALPYYASNPTYLLREGRFGNFVHFSRAGKLDISLGDIVRVARDIQTTSHAPVVVVLKHKIEDLQPDHLYHEGYNWTFSASEDDIKYFNNNFDKVARFDQSWGDENYDVYVIKS